MASNRKPDPYKVDFETAPLTDEEIKHLRPALEVFAERGIPLPKGPGRPVSGKGKQQVTLRLDNEIIDLRARHRRHQMFDHPDADAVFGDDGAEARFSDMVVTGRNIAIAIGAAKHDAPPHLCRLQRHVHGRASVKGDAFYRNGAAQGASRGHGRTIMFSTPRGTSFRTRRGMKWQ